MSKLVDVRYMPLERTAVLLARLCYRVGLSIEEAQPASTVKLMQASQAIGSHLYQLTVPFTPDSPQLNLKRATRAAICVRGILRRLQKHEQGAQDQVTAALEITERLIEMLAHAPPPGAPPA